MAKLSNTDMVALALVAGIIGYYLWKKNQDNMKIQPDEPPPPPGGPPAQLLPDTSGNGNGDTTGDHWFDNLPDGVKVQYLT